MLSTFCRRYREKSLAVSSINDDGVLQQKDDQVSVEVDDIFLFVDV